LLINLASQQPNGR